MSALPWALAEGRGIYMVEDTGTPEPSQPGRFVALPVSVLACPDLTPGSIVLYAWLMQHDGDRGCFPSCALLAREMHVSERAVSTYRRQLEAVGILEHRRGGGSASNRYTLLPGNLHPKSAKSADLEPAKSADMEPKSAKSAGDVGKICRNMSAKSADELDPWNYTHERDIPLPTGAARANGLVSPGSLADEPPRAAPKPKREQPSEDAFACLHAWCLAANKRLEGDDRRRKALLMGDLLRQCPGGKDEALRYIAHDLRAREARGKPPNVSYLVQDYHEAWERENHGGRPSETGRGQRAVPGETGDAAAEAQKRADKRAYLDRQRALARAVVPAVPVSDP